MCRIVDTSNLPIETDKLKEIVTEALELAIEQAVTPARQKRFKAALLAYQAAQMPAPF